MWSLPGIMDLLSDKGVELGRNIYFIFMLLHRIQYNVLISNNIINDKTT